MTISIDRVNPGDLIKAKFFNDVADALEAIDARLTALEGGPVSGGGTKLEITDVVPEEPTVGEVMEIHGHNFAVPTILDTVTLDGKPLTAILPGSSDELLRVALTGAFSGLPRPLTLMVQTPTESATKTVRVLPAEILPVGKPSVTDTTTGIGTILVGSTYTFVFRIDAINVTIAEAYRLEALFSDVAGATAQQWLSGTTFVGAAGGMLTVTPGEPVSVGVNITIPAGATKATLSLRAVSTHNDPGSTATSLPVAIVVGQTQPDNSPLIHIDLGQLNNNFRLVQVGGQSVLQIRYPVSGSRNVSVPISALFDDAGTYDFTAKLDNAGTLWTLGAVNPTNAQQPAGGRLPITIALSLNVTAASAERRTLSFTAKRRETTAPGQITSHMDIPIEGF
jgi:hypothetical protein